MKRVFTQTISGRYPVGLIRDWPMSTWNWIANSIHLPLDEFSKPKVEETFDPTQTKKAEGRRLAT